MIRNMLALVGLGTLGYFGKKAYDEHVRLQDEVEQLSNQVGDQERRIKAQQTEINSLQARQNNNG